MITACIEPAEPLQPGTREDGRDELAAVELGEARPDIAAQRHDGEVGPRVEKLRLAPHRGGADDGALRQIGDAARALRDQRVARVLARQAARDREAGRQQRRHVLQRMDGEVDRAGEQRLLDLLGEEPLAALVGERARRGTVAAGADRHDLERALGGERGMRGGEPRLGLCGLRERQGTAAAAETQNGCHAVPVLGNPLG